MAAQHLAVGELGNQIVDRLVEAQDALLDERHRRGGGDRLAQRGDAEDGVSAKRPRLGERGASDDIDLDVIAACDEGDEPGHLARRHVRRHQLV